MIQDFAAINKIDNFTFVIIHVYLRLTQFYSKDIRPRLTYSVFHKGPSSRTNLYSLFHKRP